MIENQDLAHESFGVARKSRGFLHTMSSLLDRSIFARQLGLSFGGARDVYAAFGWDVTISPTSIWDMYTRGGIAKRVVHAYPDAAWSRKPQLYVKGNDAWNKSWDTLATSTDLWAALRRLDILADLGTYAILIIGTDSGRLEQPLKKASKVTYLQPYGDRAVTISRWCADTTNPRFGLPEEYLVQPQLGTSQQRRATSGGIASVQPLQKSFKVHASRVLHVNHGGLENQVYGVPSYVPIWNYLTDLIKVIGASSESYWMTAYKGMHANIEDADTELDATDEANLTAELDEYQHGLRRFIRTRGMSVKALGNESIADPRGAFGVLLTLIAGTSGIPQRVLIGSEAGQLASVQDKANWAERIEEYRAMHCEPKILRPLLLWLNEHQVLETDITQVEYLWPAAYRQSPLERGQTAAQTARTIANIQKGLQPIVLTPGSPGGVDPLTGQVTEATADVTAEPLITRDEARKIIGLSTDQQALSESPD